MAITIVKEDGTAVAGANAFETVAETSTRLTDRGFTAFSLAGSSQAGALVRGTQAVMTILNGHMTGRKTTTGQGLDVPRINWYVKGRTTLSTDIPEDLLLACAYKVEEVAARLAGAAEKPDGVKRIKSDRVEVEFEEDGGAGGPAAAEARRHLRILIGRGRRAAA